MDLQEEKVVNCDKSIFVIMQIKALIPHNLVLVVLVFKLEFKRNVLKFSFLILQSKTLDIKISFTADIHSIIRHLPS